VNCKCVNVNVNVKVNKFLAFFVKSWRMSSILINKGSKIKKKNFFLQFGIEKSFSQEWFLEKRILKSN